MSVISLPRRHEAPPRRSQRGSAGAQHRVERHSVLERWTKRSTATKVAVITMATVSVILMGNAYATQRQVQLHELQNGLLQQQSKYATQVAALTNAAAPAKVAARAGQLHLVVPMSVTQIPAADLSTPLPLPTLNRAYQPISRTYR